MIEFMVLVICLVALLKVFTDYKRLVLDKRDAMTRPRWGRGK
jgi:hypothetical protein